jgi:hypothetical protein
MRYIHPLQEVKVCTQSRYNGQLNIRNTERKQWAFYYHLGQLVWAIGGTHPSLSNNWTKAGLAGFSPDLAPVLIKLEELMIACVDDSPPVYQLLEKLLLPMALDFLK